MKIVDLEKKMRDLKDPRFYKVSVNEQVDYRLKQKTNYLDWEQQLKDNLKSNLYAKYDRNMRNRVITTHLSKEDKVGQTPGLAKNKAFYKAFIFNQISRNRLPYVSQIHQNTLPSENSFI